ncbi:hypothetical protein DENSPDRAFT_844332 [Dentipellis sp. KUC8613]|nr:hypothetical protein DENSPDRAFT_844332 [Dentipellis sp. KUC8613]
MRHRASRRVWEGISLRGAIAVPVPAPMSLLGVRYPTCSDTQISGVSPSWQKRQPSYFSCPSPTFHDHAGSPCAPRRFSSSIPRPTASYPSAPPGAPICTLSSPAEVAHSTALSPSGTGSIPAPPHSFASVSICIEYVRARYRMRPIRARLDPSTGSGRLRDGSECAMWNVGCNIPLRFWPT